jgi:hypothetical protein
MELYITETLFLFFLEVAKIAGTKQRIIFSYCQRSGVWFVSHIKNLLQITNINRLINYTRCCV